MTREEAKAMEGTEFIYEFADGDTMSAYVKKVDVKQVRCPAGVSVLLLTRDTNLNH